MPAPLRGMLSFFKVKPPVSEAEKQRLHVEGQTRRDAVAAEVTRQRRAADLLLQGWQIGREPFQNNGRMSGAARWILGMHRMAHAIVDPENDQQLPAEVITSVPGFTKLSALEADIDYASKYHNLLDQANAVQAAEQVAGVHTEHALNSEPFLCAAAIQETMQRADARFSFEAQVGDTVEFLADWKLGNVWFT